MKLNKFKKSQASIFMIIGLLLIIGGGVFFYATQKIEKPEDQKIKLVKEQVPIEFNPIRDFADDCVYSVASKGLEIMGQQGGYISLSNKTLNKESFTIKQTPTESDAVIFAKGSDLKIPYWWYLKSANNCKGNCQFATKRPALRESDNSVEKQLERYIDAEFESCLDNFASVADQGFKVSTKAKPKTDVIIGTEDVTVIVDYPLTAESPEAKIDLRQFSANIPLNLQKIYELSTKITNFEIKYSFLEKHILNLIVAFSGVDKEKLPPMSDMQFKFGSTVSWQKNDIKNHVTGLLASYVPLFQVDGTGNYDRNVFDSELKQSLYDSTIIPVANSSFENLEAYFTYLDFWPAYFDLNCKGERCSPSSTNTLFSFFGIQEYKFAYDISFPVLVEVKDPEALNGRGYSFNFFLEGNVRNNKPMPGNFDTLDVPSLSERSQLCDFRTSGKVTVKVVDAATKKPINDAQVLYTLIGESCYIGPSDESGIVSDSFPVGAGGVVNVVKDGYIGKAIEFDPQLDEEGSIDTELHPIYTKKVIVKKKKVVKTAEGWKFNDIAEDLSSKESVSISLTRINSENELEFSSVANYDGQVTEMEIAPGDYSADLTLILKEKIVIPEQERCEGIVPVRKCYTIPSIDFSQGSSAGEERFVSGGLQLNFNIDAKDLEAYNTIVLYVVSIDLAVVPEQDRVIEDLEQFGKIKSYSDKNKNALLPTFE